MGTVKTAVCTLQCYRCRLWFVAHKPVNTPYLQRQCHRFVTGSALSLSTRNCHLPVPLLHQTLAAPWCISTCTTLPPTPASIPVTVAVSCPTHRPNPHHMSDAVSSCRTQAVLQPQSGTLPCAEPPTHPPDPPHLCLTCMRWPDETQESHEHPLPPANVPAHSVATL